jgi:hypothetical protein
MGICLQHNLSFLMAVSSLLFKGVPSPLNLKNFSCTHCENSSVENEASFDNTVPKEMKDSLIKHEMLKGLSPIWQNVFAF